MENLTEQESREVLGRQREEVGSGDRIQEARRRFGLNKIRPHTRVGRWMRCWGLTGVPLGLPASASSMKREGRPPGRRGPEDEALPTEGEGLKQTWGVGERTGNTQSLPAGTKGLQGA